MRELERKFVVRLTGDWAEAAASALWIEQGYLGRDPEVRVRTAFSTAGFVSELTIKLLNTPLYSSKVLDREELTWPLLPSEAGALLARCPTRVIKQRYQLSRWSIDVLQGPRAGLVLAEIELADLNEALPPAPHGVVLLEDVSQDAQYHNAALAW